VKLGSGVTMKFIDIPEEKTKSGNTFKTGDKSGDKRKSVENKVTVLFPVASTSSASNKTLPKSSNGEANTKIGTNSTVANEDKAKIQSKKKEDTQNDDITILDNSEMKFSNSMKDVVRTKCQICKETVKMTGLRGHTKSSHKLAIADYKQKYGHPKKHIIEKIYHKCGLCNEPILLDSDEVAKHLLKYHKITHGDYNRKYMNMVNGGNMQNSNDDSLKQSRSSIGGWKEDPVTKSSLVNFNVKENNTSKLSSNKVINASTKDSSAKINHKSSTENTKTAEKTNVGVNSFVIDFSDGNTKIIEGNSNANTKSNSKISDDKTKSKSKKISDIIQTLKKTGNVDKQKTKRDSSNDKRVDQNKDANDISEIENESGVKFSNSMKDAVRTRCMICRNSTPLTSLRTHTKKIHKVSIADYRLKYGDPKTKLIEKIYHKCGLCNEQILLDSDEIAKHLVKSHEITHRDYNSKYMTLVKEAPVAVISDKKSIEKSNFAVNKKVKSLTSSLPASMMTEEDETMFFSDEDDDEGGPSTGVNITLEERENNLEELSRLQRMMLKNRTGDSDDEEISEDDGIGRSD